jgi:hypothetical protein
MKLVIAVLLIAVAANTVALGHYAFYERWNQHETQTGAVTTFTTPSGGPKQLPPASPDRSSPSGKAV